MARDVVGGTFTALIGLGARPILWGATTLLRSDAVANTCLVAALPALKLARHTATILLDVAWYLEEEFFPPPPPDPLAAYDE